ncbi:MAG TPA: hypothetical protein VNJ54_13590 [Plantibacter sp.]|uniref:hypothetical protein n=1 Tax=unclassified Plantibacter TaxID=2624265 RepID=UPI002BF13A26|nr:hypothetical protein [Plantibacter sp.]
MRRLRVAGETYYVADVLGAAFLEYLQALASAGAAGIVALPALTADGVPTRLEFLAGASSQTLLTPAVVSFAEPESADAVARLRQLTRGLAPEQVKLARPQDLRPRDLEFDERADA